MVCSALIKVTFCLYPYLYNFQKHLFQVTSEGDVKKALQVAKNKFGRLDILVNCAGYSTAHQTYNFLKDKECDLEGFTKCVNVSVIDLCQFKATTDHAWHFEL